MMVAGDGRFGFSIAAKHGILTQRAGVGRRSQSCIGGAAAGFDQRKLGKTLKIHDMHTATTLIRATVGAGLQAMLPPGGTPTWGHFGHFGKPDANDAPPLIDAGSESPPQRHALVVPIRSLGPAHAGRIEAHLLQLDAHDRYLRFGFTANDEQIGRYVAGLDFDRDDIYGIYNRRLQLVATAHLARSSDEQSANCAEFGVSVLKSVRGRGYGSRLFERAMLHARNEGVDLLFIHALSENAPMLAIARKNGALIERQGSESEAHLMLPPADLESRIEEFVDDRVANIDFELKLQAKHFWGFLAAVQALRSRLPRSE